MDPYRNKYKSDHFKIFNRYILHSLHDIPLILVFINLSLLKCEIKIQIYRKIKVHSFLRFRIYLSMTFHLCISFYS